jgi:L-histidine N-alpha-methyltransferase
MSTLVSASSKIEAGFAADVRGGLTLTGQKELHSQYLYDDLGSALFEAITLLPEYGLTRADTRLLQRYSSEIVERIGGPVYVAELGSGTGQKTRYVLEALRARQSSVRYSPIDVSRLALAHCERVLAGVADVEPVLDSYIFGVVRAAESRKSNEKLLVLFLGSTIGNFTRPKAFEFLSELREILLPGDYLLIGADLVKPIQQLIDAYDDPTGVTAAFNLNLLARVNRELDANFNLRCFRHEARYNSQEQRVEMHLASTVNQRVSVPGAGCMIDFVAGETIWTESSHKYQLRELNAMATRNGFGVEAQWVDREWPFAESLWVVL